MFDDDVEQQDNQSPEDQDKLQQLLAQLLPQQMSPAAMLPAVKVPTTPDAAASNVAPSAPVVNGDLNIGKPSVIPKEQPFVGPPVPPEMENSLPKIDFGQNTNSPDALNALAKPTGTVPPSLATPTPTRKQSEEAELNRLTNPALESSKSGIGQIQSGFLRGLARVGDIAGSALFPTVMAQVPGTTFHHQMLVNDARQNLANDTAQEQADLNKGKTQAEIYKDMHGDTGKTPEETTIHDLMTGQNGQPRINPDTGKPYTYLEAFGAVQGVKADNKPDKDPVIDNGKLAPINASLERRYQVLNPGQPLPDDLKLQKGATEKDFARVDKLLQQTEAAKGTAAQQAETNALRQQTMVLAQNNANDRKAQHDDAVQQHASDKFEGGPLKQYQSKATEAQQLLEVDRQAQAGNITSARAVILKTIGVANPDGTKRYNSNEADQLLAQGSYSDRAKGFLKNILTGDQYTDKMHQDILGFGQGQLKVAEKEFRAGTRDINSTYDTKIDPDKFIQNHKEAEFEVPDGAPAAPKEDGKFLKVNGTVVAKSKGGQWVAP